ncbi:hypothetical protein GCM10009560_59730 [Nonomuraea longicatena]|uniref:Glycosyltransferase RgtA/B/C/D-like domain-containing protein n=1 Tax=Nonomuraea longicatena TaxID=83682 RepID=A0ABP4B2D6_9ACTN
MESSSRAFALLRAHWVLLALLVPAVALRLTAMAGYPPALWFWADSFSYLRDPAPGTFRPAGYSLFLALLRPLHSLALVTAVQHLIGLAVGVSVYALLHRRGLPGWGAALLVSPILLDEFLILAEHMIMADAQFLALVTGAVLALLAGRYGLAGALLAAATLTRTIGLPVLVIGLAYALIQVASGHRARRRLVALGLTALLPIGGYLAWSGLTTGAYTLTGADGMFLWARTMSFADCAVIRPRDTRLCPGLPVGQRPAPAFWVWGPKLKQFPSKERNARAGAFARAAILAQPGDYLAAVAKDLGQVLRWERTEPPRVGGRRNPYHFPLAERPVQDEIAERYERGPAATRLVAPYTGWLRGYQRWGYLPYPMVMAVLAAAATLAAVRRRWEALLPVAVALALIVLPPLLTGWDVRYVIPAIPLACLALGLALSTGPQPQEATGDARHRRRHAQAGDPRPPGSGHRPRAAEAGFLRRLRRAPGQALRAGDRRPGH